MVKLIKKELSVFLSMLGVFVLSGFMLDALFANVELGWVLFFGFWFYEFYLYIKVLTIQKKEENIVIYSSIGLLFVIALLCSAYAISRVIVHGSDNNIFEATLSAIVGSGFVSLFLSVIPCAICAIWLKAKGRPMSHSKDLAIYFIICSSMLPLMVAFACIAIVRSPMK